MIDSHAVMVTMMTALLHSLEFISFHYAMDEIIDIFYLDRELRYISRLIIKWSKLAIVLLQINLISADTRYEKKGEIISKLDGINHMQQEKKCRSSCDYIYFSRFRQKKLNEYISRKNLYVNHFATNECNREPK